MIIKCKVCGGDIEFDSGATYGTCEYCGRMSTIPKTDDESKLNRYNRANHFRRQCEFDKAVAAYEKILEQDDTDAEAHWGAAISRYGIEYVEDPATKERIPTCHRVQLTSILADDDYKATVNYAPDAESRRIYEEEAARIAEIQKGILAISQNEKPYDVFICYKETDDSGQRTRDSQWAQEVYYGLTEQGYKVFFSRITLEDKLGQEYEPYIFAALQSARVMVVIGSKPEYFNAVWVRNEWNRYLALMTHDKKRLLIPCYRDMDPYDLPDELSNLQSQDMSKIGFMQDLIRGIRKVLDSEKRTETPKAVQQVTNTVASDVSAPGVTSLMKRVRLFLEDGDFKQASEYIDRILDIDPEYAPAYAAKVCVTFGIRKEADLAETTFQYEDNPDWKKVVRFADPQQKAVYGEYAAKVKDRVAIQIRNYAYDCATEMAVSPSADRTKLDAELAAYKASCTQSTGRRADGSRRVGFQTNEDAFDRAVKSNEPGEVSESSLKTAATMFDAIGDDDAKKHAKQCRTLAEQAKQKAIHRIRNYAYDCAMEMAASPLADRGKLDAELAAYKASYTQSSSSRRVNGSRRDGFQIKEDAFNRAVKANEPGEMTESSLKIAAAMFDAIGDDEAKERARQCRTLAEQARQKSIYHKASSIRDSKQNNPSSPEEAARVFETIPDYKNARMQKQACLDQAESIRSDLYESAVNAMETAGEESGKWDEVKKQLAEAELTGYRDIEKLRTEAARRYDECSDAEQEERQRRKVAATAAKKRRYKILGGLAAVLIVAIVLVVMLVIIPWKKYRNAIALQQEGKYEEAIAAFEALNGYGDSEEQIKASRVAQYSIGSYVKFGAYPQTEYGRYGTPIEWLVLANDGQKALLISRYGLDVQPYNEKRTSITWEDSTLRIWLNSTFLNNAFNSTEQAGILVTDIDNSASQGYSGWSISDGNNTQDKIFLLSYMEANRYLTVTRKDSNNTKSRVAPTEYALKKAGAWTSGKYSTADGDAAGWWWLRSPGSYQYNAACVYSDGSLDNRDVDLASGCVRPALWIDLESDVF